jgi:hypothetical protein
MSENLAKYSQEKQTRAKFWPQAVCTNSLDRFAPGAKKYRQRFDLMFGPGAFRRLRRYRHPGGRKKITVEIEISQ